MTRLCKICSCPVENGHKVIAYHLDALFTEVLKCLYVVFDILISCRKTDLDIVMDINAFDTADLKSGSLNLFLKRTDRFSCPNLTGLCAVKSCDNSFHTGNLTNFIEGNAVIACTKPSESHFHDKFPPFYIYNFSFLPQNAAYHFNYNLNPLILPLQLRFFIL